MISNRANLDDNHSSSTYLVLTFILLLLSAIGIYFYLQLPQDVGISQPIEVAEPTIVEPSPAATPTATPTISVISTSVPTPTHKTMIIDADKFSVVYQSYRVEYHDKEGEGNRYTLYSPSGNISIHVGQKWSWVYSNRQFTSDLLVANNPTFVYDITSQKIIDFQYGGKNYTIQCVHNGKTSNRAECDQLLKDFKLL